MNYDNQIPEPILFNPFKHHLGFIKEFISRNIDKPGLNIEMLSKEIKHLGTSVMDIYIGKLLVSNICIETVEFLCNEGILFKETYSSWAGSNADSFRLITLSDGSQWTLKFHNDNQRFVHLFPARNSSHTFRVKANSLKSALIYNIIIGKDLVTSEDLNKVRPILGLSPVKDAIDTEAILEMIEILRE
jgi:hypothetical protein